MKLTVLIVMTTLFYSCNANRRIAQSYYYVEPFKEQEIKLTLNFDSTFKFQDLIGCNQFEFEGRYKQKNDTAGQYMVFDSVIFKKVLPLFNSDLIFAINNGDTAWVINKERIFIHKQPFTFTSKNNVNLQEIRYKKLEEYYTNLLGWEGFLKAFGNGKGKKEAKKALLTCTTPDINFR